LNRQLMQTGKMASIGELSAGVAHEINNPMAIIMTERQILVDLASRTPDLDQKFKAQLEKSLSQVDDQLKRCKNITNNLLKFARRTRSELKVVNINEFLTEIKDLMEREAATCGIKFLTDLDPDVKPILSDPSQLQQVFLNLITNAIDAHDGKPYGSISLQTTGLHNLQYVKVVVADTGAGIEPENLDRVFDPFFTTKPVGKGTGLGLSICYSIVKQLGGNITVRSEGPGKGAEFTVLLPCLPPQELRET